MKKTLIEIAMEWKEYYYWCIDNGKKPSNGSTVSEYIKQKGQ